MLTRALLVAAALPFLAACSNNHKAKTTRDGDWSRSAATAPGMMNSTCLISGKPVGAGSPTATHHGKTYGLCCQGCVGKFNAMSDAEKAEHIAAHK